MSLVWLFTIVQLLVNTSVLSRGSYNIQLTWKFFFLSCCLFSAVPGADPALLPAHKVTKLDVWCLYVSFVYIASAVVFTGKVSRNLPNVTFFVFPVYVFSCLLLRVLGTWLLSLVGFFLCYNYCIAYHRIAVTMVARVMESCMYLIVGTFYVVLPWMCRVVYSE